MAESDWDIDVPRQMEFFGHYKANVLEVLRTLGPSLDQEPALHIQPVQRCRKRKPRLSYRHIKQLIAPGKKRRTS
jgi:hypothetical protein